MRITTWAPCPPEPRTLRYRLLGPIEVETGDGRLVPFARRQTRALLAILLLQPGAVVSVDRLCELLWDGTPPDRTRRAVHAHVSRIRATLAMAASSTVLISHRFGYRIEVDADAVDAHRFRALLRLADTTGELDERDRLLGEALRLWRGPALQNVASDEVRARLVADLDLLRERAVEDRLETRLDLGRHRDLLGELARLTAEQPANERLAALYVRALHQNGWTVEALRAFDRIRHHLADEFGLDPGAPLRRLHLAVVRGEADLCQPFGRGNGR